MLAWLLAGALAQGASGGPLSPEQAAFDVRHVALALKVDPEQRSLAGEMRLTAELAAPASRVPLDLDQRFTVERVELQGSASVALDFTHADGRLGITLPAEQPAGSRLVLAVHYAGQPRVAPNPPWNGGFTWSRTADGRPWIATSCQGEGADAWWPCKDHPSDKPETMELAFTVPAGLVAASNGTLERVEEHEGGWRTFHWRVQNPISNYNVALNVAPFEVAEAELESVAGGTFPVRFWHLPEHAQQARKLLPEVLDHLRFFEELLGPYPFRNEKYGLVETPHLGMEHQTIIAYGYRFQQAPPGYDWLHHHEASHEWWANLVTCRDWKDMWIHEGFGSYMQALYLERRFGADAYREFMADKRRTLENARAVAPHEPRDSKQIYFGESGRSDSDIYYKGAWILHALRWVLGDEAFFPFQRRMAYPTAELERVTDGSQVRFVDTDDVRAAAERAAGRDLGWFFELYLRRPELPELAVEERDGRLELAWRTPLDGAFPLPVPVRLGGELVRVELPGGQGTLELGLKPYEIDPDRWLLRAR
jgi:aminopeptidase N